MSIVRFSHFFPFCYRNRHHPLDVWLLNKYIHPSSVPFRRACASRCNRTKKKRISYSFRKLRKWNEGIIVLCIILPLMAYQGFGFFFLFRFCICEIAYISVLFFHFFSSVEPFSFRLNYECLGGCGVFNGIKKWACICISIIRWVLSFSIRYHNFPLEYFSNGKLEW